MLTNWQKDRFCVSVRNDVSLFRMADTLTPEQRHNNMAAIRSASTKPELIFRRILWRNGFRYRVNDKRFPGKPDVLLPKYRTVVFIHGCFWHGHEGCKYYTIPKTNTEFWEVKVMRNQERDQEVWRQLEAKGWFVIVVWECQLKKAVFDETLDRVAAEIVKNGERYHDFLEERRLFRMEYRRERRAKQERRAILMKEINEML